MLMQTLKQYICRISTRTEGIAELSELLKVCLSSSRCTVRQKSYGNTEDISAATVTISYNRYGHYLITAQ